jgi:hypothetical protein
MGSTGLMFALLVAGYLIGVWTACAVLRHGQDEYEDGTNLQPAPARTRPRLHQ